MSNIRPPVVINVTNPMLVKYPGSHVLQDATGVVIAVCPLLTVALPSGAWSYAEEIQNVFNGELCSPSDDAVRAAWDALIRDGWTPPSGPTGAISDILSRKR